LVPCMLSTLPPWLERREVRARSQHACYLCRATVNIGERYYKYIDPSTGWEQKACAKHVDDGRDRAWQEKRREWEKIAKSERILIDTDASGPNGERWAFVVFHVKPGEEREICRKNGHTPPQFARGPTPGEGFAVVKALEWLGEAERKGMVPILPIFMANDNFAVLRKLETRSTGGRYEELWERMAKLSDPYLKEGRFFVGGFVGEAHSYAQKNAVK